MKHIAQIQSEFLKNAKFEDLDYEDQKRYLKKHPKSKKRLTKSPSDDNEKVTALINDLETDNWKPEKEHFDKLKRYKIKSVKGLTRYLKSPKNKPSSKMKVIKILQS